MAWWARRRYGDCYREIEDLDRLDFTRAISLFSQTTKSLDGFKAVVAEIKQRMAEGVEFNYYDTICRQVANRLPNIKAFASSHDWVYFVAGRKSSNGKMLFEECRKANPNTLFISEVSEITDLCPRRAPGRGLRRYIHSQVVDGGSGGPDQGTECFGMIF